MDHMIHCFREYQPCHDGAAILKTETKNLQGEDININPFEVTESDTEEAAHDFQLVDGDDEEGDDEIDVEL